MTDKQLEHELVLKVSLLYATNITLVNLIYVPSTDSIYFVISVLIVCESSG